MLKRQTQTDKNNQLFRDDSLHQPSPYKPKASQLAPYLTEIQKRKKQRLHLQRSKKNVHQSSSKSFRIKDRSVTSLQRELLNRRQPPKKQPPLKPYAQLRPQKQRRTQSVNRHHEIEFSKTVEGKEAPTGNNFFNQLYSKVRNKLQLTNKQRKPLRRGQYETLEDHRARSQQTGQLSMYKISFTHQTHKATIQPEQQSQPQLKLGDSPTKKMENNATQNKKNNFRRNKYEAASQEVERKQYNLAANINSEMDRMDARQNQQFVKARKRQFHGSIEKSTQKYFNSESYRPIRSKNQIQLYVSTAPNPALHKASNSTNQKSDCQPRLLVSSLKPQPTNQLHQYDFDFKNDEEGLEILQSDPESSVFDLKEQDEFQKQRKKVQLQFFNKGSPRIDWSQDQCKIDQI